MFKSVLHANDSKLQWLSEQWLWGSVMYVVWYVFNTCLSTFQWYLIWYLNWNQRHAGKELAVCIIVTKIHRFNRTNKTTWPHTAPSCTQEWKIACLECYLHVYLKENKLALFKNPVDKNRLINSHYLRPLTLSSSNVLW